jgi:hypothetical protein
MVRNFLKRRSSIKPLPSSRFSVEETVARAQKLAQKQRWKKYIKAIGDSPAEAWSLTTTKSQPGTTPLHIALTCRPPLSVVESLIRILNQNFGIPAPEEVQDQQGRTSLHVAVTSGCEIAVIDRLLNGINLVMPAILRDVNGQTALHLACKSHVTTSHTKYGISVVSNVTKAIEWDRLIKTLLFRYPEAALIVENSGFTALDYLKANHPDFRIPPELEEYQCQNASYHPGEKHDDGSRECTTVQTLSLAQRHVSRITLDPTFLVDLDEDVLDTSSEEEETLTLSSEHDSQSDMPTILSENVEWQHLQEKNEMDNAFTLNHDEDFNHQVGWMCRCFA